MSIAVVVPTRDRPDSLAGCLAALGTQDAGELEIVVVDDGSADRGAVAAVVEGAPRVRVVRAPGTGPATARNLGARATDAAIVCFTDDDCAPAPSWARLLAAAAAEAGAAAGRTVAPPGSRAAVRASQAIVEHLTVSSLDAATGRLGFAPTCNLAVGRDALATLPFDEGFPAAAGEDRDWSSRAAAARSAPVYVPEAIVVHRQALDARGFARQQFAYGRGAARFRAGAADRRLAPASFYGGLVRRGFREGPAAGALVVGAQALTAAGIAAERLARD